VPLERGSTPEVIARNIAELVKSGHPREQAAAIAYAQSKVPRRPSRGRPPRDGRRERPRDALLLKAPPGREVVGGVEGLLVDAGWSLPNHPSVPFDPAAEQTARPHPEASAPDPGTPPAFTPRFDARRSRARLPRQIPPTGHERDYAAALVKIVGRARAAYRPLLEALPGILEAAQVARGDRVDGAADDLKKLLARAVDATRKAIRQPELEALAKKFAGRVSDYQKGQLTKQVRAALGSDPVLKDRGLRARVEQFAHENASLITRIPERLHGDVAALVTRAAAGGRRPTREVARDIEDRFAVSERHARLIARDQVSKFYGSLNHARQREMGVERFIWRAVGDERTRAEHAELDGETFSYDDPPEIDGEEALPSEQVNCRCWAEPIFDDLEEGDGEDGDDDENGDDDEGGDDED
jgi:SPP1 gp7 family putative phage head morphogenesis protein